ncbi:hypothetical protein NMY22_g13889 [Coprinellus aureogranulatus]|nr:hypothetical protein NMY22_g13889 [Coprinellus aureogranulatus]
MAKCLQCSATLTLHETSEVGSSPVPSSLMTTSNPHNIQQMGLPPPGPLPGPMSAQVIPPPSMHAHMGPPTLIVGPMPGQVSLQGQHPALSIDTDSHTRLASDATDATDADAATHGETLAHY